jgi:hypothetical protein
MGEERTLSVKSLSEKYVERKRQGMGGPGGRLNMVKYFQCA